MNEKLEIITCSYGPDLRRCERLCESVDKHVDAAIGHTLIVPERDQHLFASLANSRRKVVSTQGVVPGRFYQIPGFDRWWADSRGWPVRGWIMQQITKLSANYATDAELLMFADSDLVFIRDFDTDAIYRDDRLRLHRIPGAMNEGTHLQWHERAANLMGVEPGYFGSDYVGQLITWRRSNLELLQRHLQQVHGRPWHVPIAHSLRFSEYILYGSFVEHILQHGTNGHFYSEDDLVHCCWFREEADALRFGNASVDPAAMALLIQSNMHLTPSEETSVFRAAQVPTFSNAQGA